MRDPTLLISFPHKWIGLSVFTVFWAFSGQFGRDAWQADEALTLRGVLQWYEEGVLPLQAPLYYLVAATAGRIGEHICPLQDCARLASTIFALLGVWFTGLAARRLYGPGYGTVAILLLMGAFGLVIRVHALLPDVAILTGYALVLYGLAAGREHQAHALTIAVGASVLLLTRGLVDVATVVLCAALTLLLPGFSTPTYRLMLLYAGLASSLTVLVWVLYLYSQDLLTAWWSAQMATLLAPPRPDRLIDSMSWFTWPVWPLAIAAIWHELRRMGIEHPMHLPLLASVLAALAGLFAAYSHDGVAVPLLVPLTLVACYGVATLKRGAAQAFYWFGVTCFAFFAVAFWLHYTALEWEQPQRLAAHLARLTPNYIPSQVAMSDVTLAAAATLLWFAAVPFFPRARARPVLVWATGITLSWVLLITLLKPWAELSWGYRPLITAISSRIPPNACIELSAPPAVETMLRYHLGHRASVGRKQCKWLLEVVPREAALRPAAELVWEGRRPREKREWYRLYRLVNGAPQQPSRGRTSSVPPTQSSIAIDADSNAHLHETTAIHIEARFPELLALQHPGLPDLAKRPYPTFFSATAASIS